MARTRVTVIYNPVSGSGSAKKIAELTVVPVLRLAGLDFKVVPTTHRGFATDFVRNMDITQCDTVVVCGGDGMVSEVITGLLTRPDNAADKVFVGIVPSGTANAMANELDGYRAKSHVSLTGNASLAVAEGRWRYVDVLKVAMGDATIYGLSCIGWGLAGSVAQMADKLRWIPGQRKARYDIAGFVIMLTDWPLKCHCTMYFPPGAITVKPDSSSSSSADAPDSNGVARTNTSSSAGSHASADTKGAAAAAASGSETASTTTTATSPDDAAAATGSEGAPPAAPAAATTPASPPSTPAAGASGKGGKEYDEHGWEKVGPINLLNFICSNVPKLGKDHPISPLISVDDGQLVVAWLDDTKSRAQVVNAALAMKQGKYLAHHHLMEARVATEFKCVPSLDKKVDVPYNIDGDPVPPAPMHASIIRKGLRVYCLTGQELR